MLSSIDCCQNRVSADQYHLTVSRAQVSTHQSRYFLKLSADNFLVFKWSQAHVYFFLRFWFHSDLRRKNSANFFKIQAGRHVLSRVGHAQHPIFMLWLVKIWQVSSCVNLCSILKVVYFDSWSWQSLESTCDVFNCLFPLDLQNEIQLLSRVFSYSWLVCLLGFWLRNASLPCWMRTRIINRTWTIDENRWSGNQSMTID